MLPLSRWEVLKEGCFFMSGLNSSPVKARKIIDLNFCIVKVVRCWLHFLLWSRVGFVSWKADSFGGSLQGIFHS